MPAIAEFVLRLLAGWIAFAAIVAGVVVWRLMP